MQNLSSTEFYIYYSMYRKLCRKERSSLSTEPYKTTFFVFVTTQLLPKNEAKGESLTKA